MAIEVAEDDRLTLEGQVCFTLTVASREVIALYRPLLEPLGLTHPQYLVMLALWAQTDPITVKDLSAQLKLDPPTISPILKRLEVAGLIVRRRDPSNERSLQITLTDRGRELRRRAAGVPRAIMERLGMTMEELELLQEMITRILQRASPPLEASKAV